MMNETPLTYEIRGTDEYTLESLLRELERGGKFIVYQYCISFGVVSLIRPSPAWFVPAGESLTAPGQRYSRRTLLFGWWSARGPLNVVRTLSINRNGGVDVTGDVVRGLTSEALEMKRVMLERPYTIFAYVGKDSFKVFTKGLTPFLRERGDVRRAWLALSLETDTRPPFVVGIEVIGNEEEQAVAAVSERIRKMLLKGVDFRVVVIRPGTDEVGDALIEQGQLIYGPGIGD